MNGNGGGLQGTRRGFAPLASRAARLASVFALFMFMVPAAAPARVGDAGPAALSARYAALADRLSDNQYDRPLYLESAEAARDVSGEVYAVFDYPFAAVSSALHGAQQWCDILLLHVNTKFCRAVEDGGRTLLELGIGMKNEQPIEDAHRMLFDFRGAAIAPDYFARELRAQSGPVGTSDYRILVEAVPAGARRTFLHLTYSYSYGLAGRLAMQAYLGTSGRGKVGFTVIGHGPGGEPEYVGGVRGAVERNVMRYYLAIDAYLGALGAPAADRLEKRLRTWFAATEQYPRQLREISRAAYLDMKRSEYQRQALR